MGATDDKGHDSMQLSFYTLQCSTNTRGEQMTYFIIRVSASIMTFCLLFTNPMRSWACNYVLFWDFGLVVFSKIAEKIGFIVYDC